MTTTAKNNRIDNDGSSVERQLESLAQAAVAADRATDFYNELVERCGQCIRFASIRVERRRLGAWVTIATTQQHNSRQATDTAPHQIQHEVVVDGTATALIQVDGDCDSRQLDYAQRVVDAFGEIATDFEIRRRNRDLAAMVAERDSLLQLLGSVSRADDVRAAAATLANDGRHWCDCDRLTVFQSRGRRLAAVAMSGVDGLDRRATQVRELEQLARKALHDADAANAVVWSAHNEIFDDYADLSGARWVSIAPLRDGGGALVGALAAEMLQADPPPHVEPRVARLAEETQGLFALSATSWRNAPAALRVPIEFLRSLRSVRRFVCCSVICVAMAGLLAAPANFSIDAQGEAQPVNQHDLFAPADAEVVSIEVAHNQCVLAGQVLLRLDSAMLDFEWERLRGEMRTVDSEYMAAQATRTVPASERSPNEGSVWSARLAQLRARRDGLQRQLDLLAVRRESLVVRSPAAGRVLTWEIDRRLQTRPVARGQRLLSIAEVDGPWQVELRLPDNLLGHLEASRDSHHLRYRLATAPAVEQTAVITEIAGSVTSIDGGRPMARLVAPLGRSRQLTHPGVTVTGHIDCGRRPLGFVWFHEIIDFVRARWL